VWLRAACDFLEEEAQFSYSTDGKTFQRIGAPFRMVFQLLTFQGVRYALFSFNLQGDGGFADFDAIDVDEPNPRGLMRAIPFGGEIGLSAHGLPPREWVVTPARELLAGEGPGTRFTVVDRGLGRVALRAGRDLVSAGQNGRLGVRPGPAGPGETFQWIETFTGELILLSLSTHRYVRLDAGTGALHADSPGPHPNGRDGVRWTWTGR
jgi:hypothetical protein